MTVTKDMHPADAEKYVFKRFRWRLPEVLQELYFVATKEGKIKTLKEAKKWLKEQERVDAPQVAAKRWKAIKRQHEGREIRLRDWRDFWGQYTLFRRNVEDWNEGDEQARLLSMLREAWIKRVTKEEAKRAKSNHTVKMMLPKKYCTNMVAWTRKNVTRDVKRHSLQNALLITVTGDREKTAMWRLDECDVGGQTICLQAIPAQMSCDEILERVGEEVLKEYRNLHHTRGLRPGNRDVNYVGEGSGGEAAMDPAGADGDEALDDDDDDDEPAEVAVCAFVANSLNTGSNRGSWKPLQKGWKKKEKKDPRRIGDPPLSFGEFIRAHPQGCFVCYGRNKGFNHDHQACPIHKADTEAYKKVHGWKKHAPAGIQETKVEVTKDELSKLMSVGTELAKEIQEIKRSWVPKSDDKNKEHKENDKNKDKDKKGKKGGKKKSVNEVDAEDSTPTTTTDAPQRSPCSQGPQLGRSQDGVVGSATPSQSGNNEHKGIAAGGRSSPAPKTKDSRSGRVRASEGTNPCTHPSFATKNVFDVLQDLSESIGGSPGPQLDAADGQPEPIVHDLHQSLIELLERPEILSLHAVHRVGHERQLHLKVRVLCGEVKKVFDVLVDTGAQVSLVKAGLLPPECLTDSRKPVRLKVANGQYMVGGTKEAAIGLQFVNHRELSRPDLDKEILLQGRFYEAEMDWDMIVGYDFMMETDSGVLPAQASMTLYQDDQLSWLSSPEHHVECQWIHPERNQLEVAALGTEPTGPANQEYGVMPEVASRVVAGLGASDLALDAFSSGTSAHLRVCEKYWSAQDSAWKKHWAPHQGLMWIHCPRGDIPRAVAKIRKDRSKAVLVVPMGCTEEESTRDWVVSLTNMTVNKVVLPAGESVYQDAKGQPMPPQRWPTDFHYVDGGLEQADTTDFVCVNRIIAEPWWQCFAVSPVDIGESEDPLTEEELDLVQGYMDQPFHDWGIQREGKGQDKAWWEVDSILSGSYDGNTFVKRVLDHMSSQDEPIGGNPPTYGDLFRGKTRDGPLGHLGRPPKRSCGGTPQVSSVVQVPGNAKAESDDCPKIQALRARLKQKYGETFFSGKPVFHPPVRGPYGEAKIRLKPDPRVYQHREFALRGERKEAMEKILCEFIERGWLEPCHSEWASPCFVVPKKVAGEWRLVVDYRGVNAQTQHDSYTLPLIEDMLQKQHRRRMFTVIDLKHSYHQMPLAEESRACTAMSTPLGPLQWKVMPMGVTNGNAAFQRMLENLLEPVRDCADPFVDDMIIASGDPSMSYEELLEAHERDVTRVLDLLVRHKLTGSSDKATIAVSEVVFAGEVVGNGQRKPIPGKVAAIEHWEKPKTVSELRAYLGVCNYYSGYIKMYAEYAAPMTTMLKGNREETKKGSKKALVWNEDSDRAFEGMKQALLSAVGLHLVDADQGFFLRTDASDHAVGAVLEEVLDDGRHVPVDFWSRVLAEGQRRTWTPREKEV